MRLKLRWVKYHRNWDFLSSQNEIWLLKKIISLSNDFSKLYFRRDTRVCVHLYSVQIKRILTEATWKILADAFFQMFLFDDPPPPENISQTYFMDGSKGSTKKKWVKKILENSNTLSSVFFHNAALESYLQRTPSRILCSFSPDYSLKMLLDTESNITEGLAKIEFWIRHWNT